jgi:hypothetical protein
MCSIVFKTQHVARTYILLVYVVLVNRYVIGLVSTNAHVQDIES